jgi:hypothetical protein
MRRLAATCADDVQAWEIALGLAREWDGTIPELAAAALDRVGPTDRDGAHSHDILAPRGRVPIGAVGR